MTPFLKGAAYGFLIAATVGPIWILCLRRTLAEGWRAGLASGLGAAAADALYGAVAAFSLAAVTRTLVSWHLPLQVGGGCFLVYLGLRSGFASSNSDARLVVSEPNLFRLFTTTFALTVANPMTILSFAAAFAGLSDAGGTTWQASAALVTGVFAGSTAWWIILALSADKLGSQLKPAGYRAINIASGLCIAAFGLWQLWAVATESSRP